MDYPEQIRERLRQMASEVGPDNTLIGKVSSVDEDNLVCDIKDDDGLDFYDVRLQPVLDGNESVTLFPKVGCWAVAIRLEDSDDFFLIACTELDKWRLTVGETIVEQNSNGLLVKKGDDTLKEALSLIVEAVQVIVVSSGTNPDYTKLIQAQAKINNLLR